jgi:serine protease AprX
MDMKSANWRRPARPPEPLSRRAPGVLMALLMLIAIGATFITAQPASARGDRNRMQARLSQEIDARPNATFRVIVQRSSDTRASDRAAESRGGRKRRDLKNGFVADLSASGIVELSNNPFVKYIALDAPMVETGNVDGSLNTAIYPRAVEAPPLWNQGITGANVSIAVIDSGINNRLPEWGGSWFGSRVLVRRTFTDSRPAGRDPSGHGTLVAGIAAGNSLPNTNPSVKGRFMGVAPGANLIDLVVADANGRSYSSDVVEAIEWAIANREAYNIRVINLSLVSSVPESYTSSMLAAAVERAWFNGIFVVAAAGNAGPDTLLYAPANDPFIMTVGASDTMGTTRRTDDGMAPWSSYGITQDGYSKPDVVAPGRYMPGPMSSQSSKLATQFPERRLADTGHTYMWMSGTSMSAPVVSGIAALAFQAHPEWTNDQLKWVLLNSSSTLIDPATGQPFPGQGAGLVSAKAVVRYTSAPSFANQGLKISQQLVSAAGSLIYDSASWSTASWSTASWSTASWSTASWSTASWSTASWSTTTLLQTSSVDVGSSGYREESPGQ